MHLDPDPETAFNVMVKRRRAEVKVSTLSAEPRREFVEANDKELNTFATYSVVEAASRQGISPSALVKRRQDVTFKVNERHGWQCKVLPTKDWPSFQHPLQPHPVDLVRFS